ncbi:MAG: hypothetical protein LBC40_04595 [Dysgonamonadaceae bacterium]|nr:hypothetical protein [Dysgonamonadaceae bacterium]
MLYKVYKIDRDIVAASIETLIEMDKSLIEEPDVVSYALGVFASSKLDVIDCILISYNKIKGYSVFTFDKAMKRRLI